MKTNFFTVTKPDLQCMGKLSKRWLYITAANINVFHFVYRLLYNKKRYFSRLFYKPGVFLDGTPTLVMGDGDGTVNRRSLEGCLHWQGQQKQKIYSKQLPKIDHMTILRDKQTTSYIHDLIQSLND